jgi:hypothetical protein
MLVLPALAGEEWDKVKSLPGGSELKIYETGAAQPKLAAFADLTESSLIVVIKKEQVAIPKARIDLIEARPNVKKAKGHMVTETHVEDSSKPDMSAGPHGPTAGPRHDTPGQPGYSSSTVYSTGGKGDFVTVYRRVSGAPVKAGPR